MYYNLNYTLYTGVDLGQKGVENNFNKKDSREEIEAK